MGEHSTQCPHRLNPTLRKRRDRFPTPSQRAAGKASKAVNISPLLPPQSSLMSVRSQVQLLRNLRWVLSGLNLNLGSCRWLSIKEYPCWCRRCGFSPWIRRIPWRRKWQPTPVFLPGKFHVQRSLAGYSPWGRWVRHDWSDWAHVLKAREK